MDVIEREIVKKLPLESESRRLFHGRGHCFPGLEDVVIDWYDPVVMIYLYSDRPQAWRLRLAAMLSSLLPRAVAIAVQDRYLLESPTKVVMGTLPGQVFAREDGFEYLLRIGDAQNIGFFPDMKNGRRLVARHAWGKTVLNLFSYSCSFSVVALAAGAEHVTNLDMNRGVLQLGRENHLHNNLDVRKASFLAHDLFKSFSKLVRGGPYDLIVCDPPAAQGKSFLAHKDWPRIIRRLPDLLAENGSVLLCRSTPKFSGTFLSRLVEEYCPGLKLQDVLDAGTDFPEADPEKGVELLFYGRDL